VRFDDRIKQKYSVVSGSIMPWPNLTEAELDSIYTRSRGVCHWCGTPQDRDGDWDADHIVPRSKGGTNSAENFWVSCSSCNRSRGARDSGDFEGEWENDSIVGEVYKLTPVDQREVGLHRQHRRNR